MTVASTRPGFWKAVRRGTDQIFAVLPLPRIHPDWISALSILTSVLVLLYLQRGMAWAAWGALLVTVLLDGMDGAVARRFHFRKNTAEARRGSLIDLIADRISEGVIFLAPGLFFPWFIFFLLNCVVGTAQAIWHRALVQPLRLAFFIALTLKLMFIR